MVKIDIKNLKIHKMSLESGLRILNKSLLSPEISEIRKKEILVEIENIKEELELINNYQNKTIKKDEFVKKLIILIQKSYLKQLEKNNITLKNGN